MDVEDDYDDAEILSEPENIGENGENGENQVPGEDGDDNEQPVVVPVKAKRVVKNPQPKLNEQTLKGKRGLTALPGHFERVQFKGKGHEEKDLNVILKTYEYWCHRLFPKFPFDHCIEKIEKLGSKKAVVTQVKKIRLDMLDEDDDGIVRNFDDNDSIAGDNQQDDIFDNVVFNDPTPIEPVTLTDEQEERIRLNRERAAQIRRQKQLQSQASTSTSTQNQDDVVPVYQQTFTEVSQPQTQPDILDYESEEDEDLDTVFNKIRRIQDDKQYESPLISVAGSSSSKPIWEESEGVEPNRHTEISQSQGSGISQKSNKSTSRNSSESDTESSSSSSGISSVKETENSARNQSPESEDVKNGSQPKANRHTEISQSQSSEISQKSNKSTIQDSSESDSESSSISSRNGSVKGTENGTRNKSPESDDIENGSQPEPKRHTEISQKSSKSESVTESLTSSSSNQDASGEQRKKGTRIQPPESEDSQD